MTTPLLMIPGPVELNSDVLAALSRPQIGHGSSTFIETFGACLDALRETFAAPDGQPIVASGSGTLAMELAVANIIEPGDRAVVIDTGYFSIRLADLLRRHGADVTLVSTPVGCAPEDVAVAATLEAGAKVLAMTHVDTSTGVLSPVQRYAALARQYQALTLVDGVCAVGGQEFRQTEWDIDLCLTGSQKALAAPPGLALVMARERALAAFRTRKTPVASYYCDWGFWLPVMRAYAARKPAYFATPAVNLVTALAKSIRQILAEGMAQRWQRHRRLSAAFKAGVEALGLRQVPEHADQRAATLTTLYYPSGMNAGLLRSVSQAGVTLAGGLHPAIADKTFRVGHMGNVELSQILTTLAAIETALDAPAGVSLTAAQACWQAG